MALKFCWLHASRAGAAAAWLSWALTKSAGGSCCEAALSAVWQQVEQPAAMVTAALCIKVYAEVCRQVEGSAGHEIKMKDILATQQMRSAIGEDQIFVLRALTGELCCTRPGQLRPTGRTPLRPQYSKSLLARLRLARGVPRLSELNCKLHESLLYPHAYGRST